MGIQTVRTISSCSHQQRTQEQQADYHCQQQEPIVAS
jgi:hypothetical protein